MDSTILLIVCIGGAAGLVGLGLAIYLAAGDIYDRFFGESEDIY